jgi:nucleoside-diphosphate-sugar epimerase
MHFLILGGTGPTGIELTRQLVQKHPEGTILIYARSPEKVPDDLKNNKVVTVVVGQLTDQEKLSEALTSVDVVLSALGPSVTKGPLHPLNTPLANAYKSLIELMHKQGVKRLICLGTPSIEDPHDKFNFAMAALVTGVKTLAYPAYKDVVAIGDTVRQQGGDLDWTIARVPLLNTGESKEVIAGYIGDGKTNTQLSRAGFAAFVVNEIQTRVWVQKAPLICSK